MKRRSPEELARLVRKYGLDPSHSTIPEALWDFRRFVFVVWRELGLPPPTKRQNEIAYKMQHGTKREMISAFRGEGKSWLASAFAMWVLAMNPALQLLILSASKQRADDFVSFCYRLMELDFLKHLTPNQGQRRSTIGFDVAGAPAAHAPSLRSMGIQSQIAGSRADYIIFDDIEVPNNSWTVGAREKLAHMVTELEAILKPDRTHFVSRLLGLGTPHTMESLYWELVRRGYNLTMWPAQFPEDPSIYNGCLAPALARELLEGDAKPGDPTDPERFTREDLEQRKAIMGLSQYRMQFMLDTTLSDESRYPLKLRDLMVLDLDDKVAPARLIYSSAQEEIDSELPIHGFRTDRWQTPRDLWGDYAPYELVHMFVDPAGRGKDECAYVVIGKLNGMLFLLDWGGFLDGYSSATLSALATIAGRYGVMDIVAEGNFGDGMWTQLLQPFLGRLEKRPALVEVKSQGRKEERILDVLEPVFQQHRIVVNRTRILSEARELEAREGQHVDQYNLWFQATHECRERDAIPHDDRLDALAIGVAYFGDLLGLSPAEAHDRALEDLQRKAREDFIEEFTGTRPAKSWISDFL